MVIHIRTAMPQQATIVAEILGEVARWLDESGRRLWEQEHVSLDSITPDVNAGRFVIAWTADERPVGVLMALDEDPMFWPEGLPGEAVYLHRLAVRREAAGQGVSSALLQWAVDRARTLGRPWVRLDCLADRPALRGIYERFGFQYYSDHQVGPYRVARYQFPAGGRSEGIS